jgi:ATP-dependent Clp protease ATP-binding subunit ClpA
VLIARIDNFFPPAQPIPQSQDMPISAELNHVFNMAKDVKRRFQSGSIEPLHLLAAALDEPSSKASQILLDAGITREKVFEALSNG